MRRMKWLGGAAIVLGLLAATPARAQETKSAVYFRASFASTDAVEKFVADLTLPMPLNLKANMEHAFPGIAPGSLAGDKPVGIALLARDGIPPDQTLLHLFPMNAGAATPDILKGQGAQPDAADPNILTLAGRVHFKRLTDHLVIGTGPSDLLNGITDDLFAKDYSSPGTLVVANLNLATLRTGAPQQYEQYIAMLNGSLGSAAPIGTPGGAFDAAAQGKVVHDMVDKLDRIAATASQEGDAVHLRTWFMPVELKAGKAFPKPSFPPGSILEMHIVYPDSDAASFVERTIAALPEKQFSDLLPGLQAKPESWKAAREVATMAVRLFFTADAQSLSLQNNAGVNVTYLVNQYSQDIDFAAQAQDLVLKCNALLTAIGSKDTLQIQTAPGAPSRVVFTVAGMPPVALDFIQNGRTVTIAISNSPTPLPVDQTAKLPPDGEINHLCVGFLDLQEIMKTIDAQFSAMTMLMPKPQLDQIRSAVAGQKITWTVQSNEQAKFVSVDLELPMPVLKMAGNMLGGMMMQAPPPAPGAPRPPARARRGAAPPPGQ